MHIPFHACQYIDLISHNYVLLSHSPDIVKLFSMSSSFKTWDHRRLASLRFLRLWMLFPQTLGVWRVNIFHHGNGVTLPRRLDLESSIWMPVIHLYFIDSIKILY